MKKLNKKGFTLVELLAVIVILAVIMVITIPTVLGSMSSATDSAAKSAIAAVQKYVDNQTELCNVDLGTLAQADSIFISGTCLVDTNKVTTILTNAGYNDEFSGITFEKVTEDAGICKAGKALGTETAKNCKINASDAENTGYLHAKNTITNKISSVTVKSGSQFGTAGETINAG